jgi:folate-dependent phosphoribosylglycinamide formyltransferase PurN
MIRVVVLAPIDNSLYARLVCYRLRQERDVQLAGIVVRSPLNFNRFLSEFNRDGARLLRKVVEKGFRGDKRFDENTEENLARLAENWELPFKSLKRLAAEYNIPYRVVSDQNHRRSEDFLHQVFPDLIVFTGGGLIRKNILLIPKLGILNCHTGILPEYRGMDVVEWTAVEGQASKVGFGATLHLMDQGVDTGPILKTTKIEMGNSKSFEQIRTKLEVKMVELMLDGVMGFRDRSIAPRPQIVESGRQYYVMHPRIKEYAKLQLLKQMRSR